MNIFFTLFLYLGFYYIIIFLIIKHLSNLSKLIFTSPLAAFFKTSYNKPGSIILTFFHKVLNFPSNIYYLLKYTSLIKITLYTINNHIRN